MKSLPLLLLLLPALMQTQKTAGQDSTSAVAVVISPALFAPVSVALQGGLQVRLTRRSSVVAEWAYPAFYPQGDYQKIRYWRSAVTLKFYSPKPQSSEKYYAVRAAYMYRQLTDADDGIVHAKDGEYRYDQATINSPVLSLALLLGKEFNTRRRKLFADVFVGAGLRHLFNSYTAKNLRLTSLDRPKDNFEWLLPEEGWRFNYSLTRFQATAGLRFGLRL